MTGVELHHVVDGSDGEPVLLLHAVGLDHTFWEPIGFALSDDHRVVRADVRGHGRSPVPPAPWTTADIARDVYELLDRLGTGPVHVVGQSFGGLVAQMLVLDHPEIVRSLVLSGTSCTTSPEEREIFLKRASTARKGGMAAVAEATVQRWYTPPAMNLPVVEKTRRRLLDNDVEGWARTFEAIAGHHVVDRLASVNVPTLVVVGDADVATPPHFSVELAKAIPGAELAILPGVPHMGPFERPDLFEPLLRSFISANSTAS